jgi:hypothetical protein
MALSISRPLPVPVCTDGQGLLSVGSCCSIKLLMVTWALSTIQFLVRSLVANSHVDAVGW